MHNSAPMRSGVHKQVNDPLALHLRARRAGTERGGLRDAWSMSVLHGPSRTLASSGWEPEGKGQDRAGAQQESTTASGSRRRPGQPALRCQPLVIAPLTNR